MADQPITDGDCKFTCHGGAVVTNVRVQRPVKITSDITEVGKVRSSVFFQGAFEEPAIDVVRKHRVSVYVE